VAGECPASKRVASVTGSLGASGTRARFGEISREEVPGLEAVAGQMYGEPRAWDSLTEEEQDDVWNEQARRNAEEDLHAIAERQWVVRHLLRLPEKR
jgi:hypothetical protein